MRLARPFVLLAAAALTLAPAAFAQLRPYNEIIVFGDSLSDDGNLFAATGQPPAPYFKGRFSNGRVWCEQLAPFLGLDQISGFAVGGATTTDVATKQVIPYIGSQGGRVRPDALYIYWAGANDMIAVLSSPGTNPTLAIQTAMQQTANALAALVAAGARNVLVLNLPDLGATPRVRAAGDSAPIAARQLTQAYNGALAQTLAGVAGALGVRPFFTLDVFSQLDQVVKTPRRFGLCNVYAAALTPSGIAPRAQCYLFWDDIHPSVRGHVILREAAQAALGQ